MRADAWIDRNVASVFGRRVCVFCVGYATGGSGTIQPLHEQRSTTKISKQACTVLFAG